MADQRKKLFIIGASGHGRDVLWLAKEIRHWNVVGFFDDTKLAGELVCDLPVLGGIADCNNYSDEGEFIIAIGDPRGRSLVARKLLECGNEIRYATLVHPSVMHSEYVEIGVGSVVCAGSILTTQVKIGQHSIINLTSTVGHDVEVGDFCTIAPRVSVSGFVKMGNGVELGVGSVIRDRVILGHGCMVAMGAVVMNNVPNAALVIGNPARPLKQLNTWAG